MIHRRTCPFATAIAVASLAIGAVVAGCSASSGNELTTISGPAPAPALSVGLTPVEQATEVPALTEPARSTSTTRVTVGETLGSTVAVPLTSADTAPVESTTTTTTTATTIATAATIGPVDAAVVASTGSLSVGQWNTLARRLGPVLLPSGCRLPLDEPGLLPNAERRYRGGIHEGIDFPCHERGHDAVAAMSGRVLFVNDTFVEADPADRQAILDDAKAIGDTPPWTLAFLFGRFVVLDHGIVPGVGHVVTIYAHLDTVDPALRPGAKIAAGTRVGEIGNRGTESAAQATEGQIHLHWELHIDDRFFGEGLSAADTSAVYRELFDLS